MSRLSCLSSSVDAENGRRMSAMMKPSLETLEAAADHSHQMPSAHEVGGHGHEAVEDEGHGGEKGKGSHAS